MGLDNPLHIAFLVVILLLIFGARRLPEIGRSLGSGMREFKQSITGESSPQQPALGAAPQQPALEATSQHPVAQPVQTVQATPLPAQADAAAHAQATEQPAPVEPRPS